MGDLLFYLQIITSALFIFSEALSMSSCECNGILHMLITWPSCRLYVDLSIEGEEIEL